MRGRKSSKSDTCPEGVVVDVAGISGKVGAHYPGRSASLPRATGIERCWDGLAEVSRGHSRWLDPAEGPTKLVAFGRFAQRDAGNSGRKRPETIYFLGFTLYCTQNLKGRFKVGMRTEKSRLRRSLANLQDLMRQARHLSIREQSEKLNRVLRGHYAYYGIAGNFRALQQVHRGVERYWRKMLSSRSRSGGVTWEAFHQIKTRFPLMRPKLHSPYRALQAIAVL